MLKHTNLARWMIISMLVVGGSLFVWNALRQRQGETEGKTWDQPVILQQVQSLGRLQTQAYHFEKIFAYETFRNPAPSLAWIPGSSGVIQATTRNRAMVGAKGTVYASVDLRQAQIRLERDVLTVILPPVELESRVDDVHLEGARSGLFWCDHSFGLKAQESARRDFLAAANAQDVSAKATESARETLKRLLEPTGLKFQVQAPSFAKKS